jgi:hypothetical protein
LIGSDKNFGFDSSDWSKNLLVDWSKNVLLDSLDWSKNLLFDSLNLESSTIELRGLERSANVSENCCSRLLETFSRNIFKAQLKIDFAQQKSKIAFVKKISLITNTIF